MEQQDLDRILHGFGNYDAPRCAKCGQDLSNKKHFVSNSRADKWLCEKDMRMYELRNGTKVVGTKAEAIKLYMTELERKGELQF